MESTKLRHGCRAKMHLPDGGEAIGYLMLRRLMCPALETIQSPCPWVLWPYGDMTLSVDSFVGHLKRFYVQQGRIRFVALPSHYTCYFDPDATFDYLDDGVSYFVHQARHRRRGKRHKLRMHIPLSSLYPEGENDAV